MANVNTRYDNLLPRLPRDESAAEQRQFNESILKALEALSITANADITRLSDSDFITNIPIGQTVTAFTESEADEFDSDDRLIAMEDSDNPSNKTFNVLIADYPDLATARPKWVDGKNIKIPNLYNRVLRHYGTDTDPAGNVQDDAMQRMTGTINGVRVHSGPSANGVFTMGNSGADNAGDGDDGTPRVFYFDNNAGGTYKTNGTGTGDGETRVKSFIVKSYVRAK